jgi:hypothetical protein
VNTSSRRQILTELSSVSGGIEKEKTKETEIGAGESAQLASPPVDAVNSDPNAKEQWTQAEQWHRPEHDKKTNNSLMTWPLGRTQGVHRDRSALGSPIQL